MFIHTEATPNPGTLKFLPGRMVSPGRSLDFRTPEEAMGISGLAERLLHVEGVEAVFLGDDFLTVSKSTENWNELKPHLLGIIMEYYLSGEPVVAADAEVPSGSVEEYSDADRAVVDQIEDLLETRVRPAVAGDGGDIQLHLYRDGVVWLRMRGACDGCPSATVTLKHGVENLLRHFIPEVSEVRSVNETQIAG